MLVIYTRISTGKQNNAGQLVEGVLTYSDVCSGSIPFMKREHAKLLIDNKAITQIRIREVSRLGRNLSDILNTIEYFTGKEIDIYIENLGLHTVVDGKVNSTATLIISIMGSIAQQEKELLKERTKIGIEIAKKKGLYKGRKVGTTENFNLKYKSEIAKINQLLLKGVSKSDIAINIGVSRVTLDKIINRVKTLK
jgi:DNA invertase Pin-like site-specific DNA recombinase